MVIIIQIRVCYNALMMLLGSRIDMNCINVWSMGIIYRKLPIPPIIISYYLIVDQLSNM